MTSFLPTRIFESPYTSDANGMFESPIGKFTVSRHFSTSGDGKSLLHNNIDKSSLQRHSGAPICTNMDAVGFNLFPIKLL